MQILSWSAGPSIMDFLFSQFSPDCLAISMNGDVDRQAGGLQEVGDQVPLDDHRVDRPHLAVGGGDQRGGRGGRRASLRRRRRGGGRGRYGGARCPWGEERAEEELEHPSPAAFSPPLTRGEHVLLKRHENRNDPCTGSRGRISAVHNPYIWRLNIHCIEQIE